MPGAVDLGGVAGWKELTGLTKCPPAPLPSSMLAFRRQLSKDSQPQLVLLARNCSLGKESRNEYRTPGAEILHWLLAGDSTESQEVMNYAEAPEDGEELITAFKDRWSFMSGKLATHLLGHQLSETQSLHQAMLAEASLGHTLEVPMWWGPRTWGDGPEDLSICPEF